MPGMLAAKGCSTVCIWRASSRVGDTMTAPTCDENTIFTIKILHLQEAMIISMCGVQT